MSKKYTLLNLIKLLLSFIFFIGTTIFSGLEFFIWTSNSNITTSNLDRTDKLIPFTYFDLESTNEKFKKRSNMDNNENNTQLYVPINTSDLPEIFKTTTETFLEISQEMHNPNNTDLLYFIFSQNFFNSFVNDLGELRKIQKEYTKKVGKIESKIIEKFSWCLKKLNLKKSEYKMTLKKKENLEKKFDRFVKNKYKKIFLDHPKYNVKYSYRLYEIFDENIKILNEFYDLIKESMVEVDCAYKYADILFEVFVYDHVFDMGRINIKKVVKYFKQFQPEKNIPKFDKFDLRTLAEERDKRAESLERFYSRNFITKEFMDKRKEYDKKTVEIIEKIVNELRYYRSNLPVTKFKMARFVRNLEDIPFIS